MTFIDSYLYLFVFILGLCFGSFLNVIIYRIPLKKSIVKPPSSCPACGNKLGIIELLPVVGYFIIKRRCRNCQTKISIQYPLVEISTGISFLLVYSYFSLTTETLFFFSLLYLLLGISLVDFKYRIIPNQLVITGIIIAFIFHLPSFASFWLAVPDSFLLSITLLDSLYGFILGSIVFILIILISKGGMGGGDLKLMAMIGLFVGLRGTATAMLLGFVAGAVVGVYFMIRGKLTRKDALPFAPFLALGTVIEVFFGDQLWNWYINLFI